MSVLLIKIMFVCLFSSVGLAFIQDQLRPEKKQETKQEVVKDSLNSDSLK